ncbi:hypothetical protein J2127_000717 [Methanococcus voltae]|uniref:hypothetical protein n=1 Tax=Methanococcus voltae TaxID=2188 RepID=UPI001AEAA983|nr:hypothetical protein [Methanococcus voltae]MBP2143562.1 hypothetical protein [Methanococcus voltae]
MVSEGNLNLNVNLSKEYFVEVEELKKILRKVKGVFDNPANLKGMQSMQINSIKSANPANLDNKNENGNYEDSKSNTLVNYGVYNIYKNYKVYKDYSYILENLNTSASVLLKSKPKSDTYESSYDLNGLKSKRVNDFEPLNEISRETNSYMGYTYENKEYPNSGLNNLNGSGKGDNNSKSDENYKNLEISLSKIYDRLDEGFKSVKKEIIDNKPIINIDIRGNDVDYDIEWEKQAKARYENS